MNFDTYSNYVIVMIQITNACNRRCSHCYISKSDFVKQEISLYDFQKFLDEVISYSNSLNKKLIVSLSGGDPLLHSEFEDFLIYLKKRNIVTAVIGNPEKITTETISVMIENNVVGYQLSLDGTKSVHDQIRGKGSYDNTIEAAKLMKKEGLKVSISYTLSKMNADCVFDLIEELEAICVDEFTVSRFVPTGEGELKMDELLSKVEYRKFMEEYMVKKWQNHKNSKLPYITFSENCLAIPLIEEVATLNKSISVNTSNYSCLASKNYVAVGSNGDVYPCMRLPIVLGNIYKDPISAIYNHEVRNEIKNKDNMKKCKHCSVQNCIGCPAIKFATGKSINAIDPQCWK